MPLARVLDALNMTIIATEGTASKLRAHGLEVTTINKVKHGSPHIVDAILGNKVDLVINTTDGTQAIRDSHSIRRATIDRGVPYFTNLSAARAAIRALETFQDQDVTIKSLQEYYQMDVDLLSIEPLSAQ